MAMHTSTRLTAPHCATAAFALWLFAISGAQGANNVAPPNVLWHNKNTGENRVWIMNGTSFLSEAALAGIPDDLGWKMIGTADMNRDGQPDIVWQHEVTGQNAVWYMQGTTIFAGALIQ